MKVTIVYESMFGNTHDVAQAIGDGLRQAQPDLISSVFRRRGFGGGRLNGLTGCRRPDTYPRHDNRV
jgi:hypothetical protein